MHKFLNYLLFVTIVAFGSSCQEGKGDQDHLVTIDTQFGRMKLILFDETPLHKENFLKLAREARYDSTIFHRVMKGFMIQGGDIDAKEGGAPSNATIPAEFVEKYYHKKGAVAAARQPDNVNPQKASSWSQFYIVHGVKFTESQLTLDQQQFGQYFQQYIGLEKCAELKSELEALYTSQDIQAYQNKVYGLISEIELEFNVKLSKPYPKDRLSDYGAKGGAPHLDGQYTVFGMVVEGLEVIDVIANLETNPGDKPVNDIYMKVSVEEVSKSKITNDYGYAYPAE